MHGEFEEARVVQFGNDTKWEAGRGEKGAEVLGLKVEPMGVEMRSDRRKSGE